MSRADVLCSRALYRPESRVAAACVAALPNNRAPRGHEWGPALHAARPAHIQAHCACRRVYRTVLSMHAVHCKLLCRFLLAVFTSTGGGMDYDSTPRSPTHPTHPAAEGCEGPACATGVRLAGFEPDGWAGWLRLEGAEGSTAPRTTYNVYSKAWAACPLGRCPKGCTAPLAQRGSHATPQRISWQQSECPRASPPGSGPHMCACALAAHTQRSRRSLNSAAAAKASHACGGWPMLHGFSAPAAL